VLERITNTNIPSIVTALGFDTAYVSPNPIGIGVHHEVYLYSPPTERAKVLKIRRDSLFGIPQTAKTEQRDLDLVASYLPRNKVAAQVLEAAGNYLVAMDFVPGRHLTLQELRRSHREEFGDIFRNNKRMVREQGMSAEFVGREGVVDLMTLGWFTGKKCRLSNLIISEDDNSLKLVGHTLIPLNLEGLSANQLKCAMIFAMNVALRKATLGW